MEPDAENATLQATNAVDGDVLTCAQSSTPTTRVFGEIAVMPYIIAELKQISNLHSVVLHTSLQYKGN